MIENLYFQKNIIFIYYKFNFECQKKLHNSISKNYHNKASKEVAIFIVFVTLFLAIKLRASIRTPDMWASTNDILIYKTWKKLDSVEWGMN
jgi:hypothetical protein